MTKTTPQHGRRRTQHSASILLLIHMRGMSNTPHCTQAAEQGSCSDAVHGYNPNLIINPPASALTLCCTQPPAQQHTHCRHASNPHRCSSYSDPLPTNLEATKGGQIWTKRGQECHHPYEAITCTAHAPRCLHHPHPYHSPRLPRGRAVDCSVACLN